MAVLLAVAGCGSTRATRVGEPMAPPTPTVGLGRSIPTWIDIPSIGARSTLVRLGLNPDRSIQVPPVDRPRQAGWYQYGPTPGQVGPAVILGHIDGDHQEGIFWRLHEVRTGDRITVGREDGSTATFAVAEVDDVHKSAFPTGAVYGNTPDPELRLITCGGAFDASTGHYLDNLIVYAKLVD